MEKQLVLIETKGQKRRPSWALDERTRQTGRQGVAEARKALAKAIKRTAA
ncbi:MAG: hypothetical protein QOG03_1907 [Actinomycetota bacterium]|jgi:hypothetical protein|nr:hypothetical protein [Actinomycetota bacterium]